jgi:hypothetical protein
MEEFLKENNLTKVSPQRCYFCQNLLEYKHNKCNTLICNKCFEEGLDVGGGQDETIFFYCPICHKK